MIRTEGKRVMGFDIRRLFATALLLIFNYTVMAQDPLMLARQLVQNGEYAKAIRMYDDMYDQTPNDPDVYRDYLDLLLEHKKYKDAEKVVRRQIEISHQHPIYFIDLGNVLHRSGKAKKGDDQFNLAVGQVNGDDMLTQQIAKAFVQLGKERYAVQVYERARNILRNPYMYYAPLARLYAKNGDLEKAVYTLLEGGLGNMRAIDDTKATLLELIGTDPNNLRLVQKALIKRINADPENIYYGDLLTWVYTQKDDWDGALIQIKAIDERNKENGRRILDFAYSARNASRFDAAIKALTVITEKGKDHPLFATAMAEKMPVYRRWLEEDPAMNTPELAHQIADEYRDFFREYPQFLATPILLDYTAFLAQYHDQAGLAIELLEKAMAQPSARRDIVGKAKLQLGDYYILEGRIWDAALIYGQVDKAFREDVLGEEARFRNARLAYYRGDFFWAQGQLSVLKASTSELIANDALYLSVLITENVTPDSNMVPLERFAYADLLLFQHKYEEATTLLDSIATAYPQHPLNDDILMLHARIAVIRREYHKAIDYLQRVITKYGSDVLADDALFQTAEILERYLGNAKEAKNFYEQLILDYPGSTYVQAARERLSALQLAL